MKPTATQLIRGIAGVLENDVLPELSPTTWAASQVRSCLAVLAHLEPRVAHERAFLLGDNEALGVLLAAAGERLTATGKASALAQTISEVLASDPPAGESELDVLTQQNEAYQNVLNTLIETLHDREAGLPADVVSDLHGQVGAYLAKLSEQERVMFAKSATMSPL